MNLVDSSAWLEYFANTKNADYFAKAIEDTQNLLVPSIVIYEVFKKIIIQSEKDIAIQNIAYMKSGLVVDFDLELALEAAKLSKEHQLPMADSIILATARLYSATIWTQDAHFKGLKGVKYFQKK